MDVSRYLTNQRSGWLRGGTCLEPPGTCRAATRRSPTSEGRRDANTTARPRARIAWWPGAYPWRCLCLGFLLQMTITTWWRRITLHPSQRGLTDARTFTCASLPAY